MKTKSILKTGITIAILSVVSACDSFLDDNLNPNLTSSSPPKLLLPSIVGGFGWHMGTELDRLSGLWSQQIAAQNGRQTENFDKYILQATEVNGAYRQAAYAGVLMDVEEMLKKSPNEVHPHYFGISKVIKAFYFSILVDYWGDIPYSEALKGIENLQPSVDDDAAIYPQLITLLDNAIIDLKATSPLTQVGAEDYIYGGSANIIRWIRAANVLKLRLYLHMANVPGFDTNAIATFINATPVTEFMTAVTDDMQLMFEATSGKQHPTHQYILNRTDDICTSSTMINMMNAKADPRRAVYFTPAPFSAALYASPPTGTTGYIGLQNGFGNGGVNNGLSRIHRYLRGAVTSTTIPAGPNLLVSGLSYNGLSQVNLLTYAEYNFVRAELAMRYSAPLAPRASVQEWYQEGIRGSFLDAGLTVAQANTYIASDADGDLITVGQLTGTPDIQLRQLIEEKYVASFMVTGEPWSDWRRTGYPLLQLLPLSLSAGNNGKVPRVLIYPQQDVDANPNMAQRANMSANRVFWDTRTTGQE